MYNTRTKLKFGFLGKHFNVEKKYKKLEKSTWQTDVIVLYYQSSARAEQKVNHSKYQETESTEYRETQECRKEKLKKF